MHEAPYRREFFDLQLTFAKAACRCSGMPLAAALLDCTNLYVRFGLGRGFDPDHPVWRQYLEGAAATDDLAAWTYGFYRSRLPESGAPEVACAVEAKNKLRNVSLWGQFLDRRKHVRRDAAMAFVADLARQDSLGGLARCFPLRALAVSAPLQVFRDFYSV